MTHDDLEQEWDTVDGPSPDTSPELDGLTIGDRVVVYEGESGSDTRLSVDAAAVITDPDAVD
ncbi:hypothetical protein [Salarchaeum japonicum]|uniref:Uncharacterized protein n=1 Tax=Salarchaeum japonicum TaxID=555573 RepID=A0AAV3T1U7_9EURY|nr:hypothetical protein [Salarchaeum japonicum]